MIPIPENDFAVLREQSAETLGAWWCDLNRWGWPEGLPDPELPHVADIPHQQTRRAQIMAWIEDTIGHRACSREWNRDMSDAEFYDFYAGTYRGDNEARGRYHEWREKRVEGLMKARP